MLDFKKYKAISIDGISLKKLAINGTQIWEKAKKDLWDLATRTGEKVGWSSASTAFNYDVSKFYYPVARTGSYNENASTISEIKIGENTLSLISSAGLYGIAVAFMLDSTKKYKFHAINGANSRVDFLQYNASNVYQGYINLGTSGATIDYIFTPTEGAFTVFGFLSSTAGATLNFSEISLTEVS